MVVPSRTIGPCCSHRAPFLLENAAGDSDPQDPVGSGLPRSLGLGSSSFGMGRSSCLASVHSSQGGGPSLALCPVAWHPEPGLCDEVCRRYLGCGRPPRGPCGDRARGAGWLTCEVFLGESSGWRGGGAEGAAHLGVRPLDGLDGTKVLLQAGDQLPLLGCRGRGLSDMHLQLCAAPCVKGTHGRQREPGVARGAFPTRPLRPTARGPTMRPASRATPGPKNSARS